LNNELESVFVPGAKAWHLDQKYTISLSRGMGFRSKPEKQGRSGCQTEETEFKTMIQFQDPGASTFSVALTRLVKNPRQARQRGKEAMEKSRKIKFDDCCKQTLTWTWEQ